jgi:glucose/arabinose dehydrogenase
MAIVCVSLLCGGVASTLGAQEIPRIKLEPFVKKTERLERPLWLTHDGTDRLFVIEQPGRVRLIVNGQMRKAPYLDLTDRVLDGGEQGLLCIVFHPQFATNGYCYVNYTRQRPRRQTVISEFHVDPASEHVDTSTERIITTIDQPYPNHNGGQILFGPDDGMLYIGMGDGGSANDPQNRAQNMSELLGKILRIDVTPREGYAVPKDNPFVGQSGARPEIWAMGLRNPWRISFDRETKLMWTGDVGQNIWEEVDIIEKGGNYGWRIMEGLHDFKPIDSPPEMTPPIKEYKHDLGLSVTGGYVYRGRKIPSLVGWYVYGDYSSGRIWGLKYENGKLTGDQLLLQSRAQPASFGEDAEGELYLCDHNGTVYKIVEGT